MRYILLIATILYVMGAGSLSVSAQNNSLGSDPLFFESLYDIPVMPGLEEVPELSVSFDKPGGRIAEAGATAENLEKQEIFGFYDKALSQMGWQKKEEGRYLREGEQLQIIIEKRPEKTATSRLVRFSLNPL